MFNQSIIFHFSDNSRLFHKKKKAIILPVLILLNLLKIKLILIPIFLGVHLIKKLIIIGGLFVPGFLSKLRICKVPHHGFTFPFHWGTAAEAPVDYPSGNLLFNYSFILLQLL